MVILRDLGENQGWKTQLCEVHVQGSFEGKASRTGNVKACAHMRFLCSVFLLFFPWERIIFKMTDKLRGACFVAATAFPPLLLLTP